MAGYVEKSLPPGERIVHRVNFNWTFSFFPVLWFAAGSAPVIMYLMLQFGSGISFEDLKFCWWASLIAFAAGALHLGFFFIVPATTEIVITTYRFVFKTGLIARNTQEVSLSKIEEIILTQSFWGRIFGYGKLVLRGTGVGVISLPNLDDPIQVRKIIENARSNLRRGTTAGSDNGDDED